jgi:hypothetical protein
MTLLRRLFLILSIVVTGSLALAAAAVAAGGGGGLGPGNYTFTQVSALAQFGTPVAPNVAPQFLISVARNHSDFRPTAGPHQVFNITTVTIQISTLAVSGFGCFTIPASNFTVSKDLQRAALHATLTTPCTGSAPPLAGVKAVSPLAGGGGGGGLPAAIRLDVTWTGDGVIGTTRDASTFQCAGYTLNRALIGSAASVTASGVVSAPSTGTLLSFSPADQGVSLSKTDTNMNITGVQMDACLNLQTL